MKSILKTLSSSLKQRKVRNTLIGLYILLIIGFSASARATEVRFYPQPVETEQFKKLQSFVGEVIVSVDGQFFLMTEETTYELRTNVDLTELNGQMVEITGLEIKHKVGPVYQLASVTPLQTEQEKLPVGPVLIVYNVSILQ